MKSQSVVGQFSFTKAITIGVLLGACTAQQVTYTTLISDVASVSAVGSDITFSIEATQPFTTQTHLWKYNETTIASVVNRVSGGITETIEEAFKTRTVISTARDSTNLQRISMNLTLSQLSREDNGFLIFVKGDVPESNRITLFVEECPNHIAPYDISIVSSHGDCGVGCQAIVSCTKGFIPTCSLATCQRNATWSALPQCESEQCHAAQEISCGVNSVCSFDDNSTVVAVNQTTALTCGNGYNGTGFATCQAGNVWEMDINCQEITCSGSITVPWSCGSCDDFNVAMDATSINDIAEFTYCGGKIVIVCTASGTWDVVTLCQQINTRDDSGLIIGLPIGCGCGGIILGVILCYWLFACDLFPLNCLEDTNCCSVKDKLKNTNSGNNLPL